MTSYLDSLERLENLCPRTLFVAHGAPFLDAGGKLAECRRHRLERETQILRLFEQGLREPAEMVSEIYPEVMPPVRPLAERQIRAHLVRLAELGAIGL